MLRKRARRSAPPGSAGFRLNKVCSDSYAGPHASDNRVESVTRSASADPSQGTRTQDGDALDAFVVGMPPAFPGCLVTTRLLGIVRVRRTESRKRLRNDRVIACVETDVTPAQFRTLDELGPHGLAAIEQFLENYNRAEGRPFRITGRGSAEDAHVAVVRAMRQFQKLRRA